MKNICQSCGMPLEKDPAGGGTEADGSKSRKYCGYCYQGGTFTFACDNVKDFQEHCRQVMAASGMSRPVAWLFSRGLGRLERWK